MFYVLFSVLCFNICVHIWKCMAASMIFSTFLLAPLNLLSSVFLNEIMKYGWLFNCESKILGKQLWRRYDDYSTIKNHILNSEIKTTFEI